MLYHIAGYIAESFGPGRLLQSHAVLIGISLFLGFFTVCLFLPKFYKYLPRDRGREFTVHAEEAKGKPTGSGIVFITIFIIVSLFCAPLNIQQSIILLLTWLIMLTGYLDDRSTTSWGELRKGLLDLIISIIAAFILYYFNSNFLQNGEVTMWFPFVTHTIVVSPWIFIILATIILWVSINTTNCTDGVDGLSSTLVLVALVTVGGLFYFILGHKHFSEYLLVPHLTDGASWAVIVFALIGVLIGYLWHNAFPSKVLMGDAGSRALGFFMGVCVIVSGNPFLLIATSTVIFINGGLGLLKVALLRFCKIKIFTNVRFPLHDHMKKKKGWSATQVLVKFVIIQFLFTIATLAILLKIR